MLNRRETRAILATFWKGYETAGNLRWFSRTQACIKLVGLVGTFRQNVRACAGADASARRPYQRIVELDAALGLQSLVQFVIAPERGMA